MPKLTIEQIAGYALGAGLSGEKAAIATAIAMAESGGQTDIKGDTTITTTTWGPSVGLWQIRSLNSQRGTGGERDELANVNPAKNAAAMFSISDRGENWRPWSVYLNGRYRAHLAAARLAVASPTAATGADTPGGGSGLEGGLDVLDGGTWARVGLFVFGGAVLTVALYRSTGLNGIPVPISKLAKVIK